MRTKREFRKDSGLTLIEVVVIAGIMGFVVLTATSMIIPAMKFSSQVRENMSETVDNDLSARVLQTELSKSYLLRLGSLSCGAIDGVLKTNSTSAPFTLKDKTAFSILYATYSSSGAVDPSSNRRLAVADASKYPNGSLILATGQQTSGTVGILRVTASDSANGRITVEQSNLDNNPTACKYKGINATLDNLVQAAQGSMLTLHRIQISHYKRDGNDVFRGVYPDQGDRAGDPKGLAFSSLADLTILGRWQSYSGNNVGRWNGEVTYKYEIKSLLEDAPSKVITSNSKVSYDLAASSRANKMVKTTASLNTVVYPTCSVSISSSPIELGLPATAAFRNSRFFLIQGHSSINASSTITVFFNLGPGAFASCYPYTQAVATPWINGSGLQGGLTLTSTGGAFSKYVCAVRGFAEVGGSMLYYDTSLKRQVGVNCSGMSVFSGTDFRHKTNMKPECFHDGQIDFGSPLVIAGSETPGPTLYVGSQSCRWSDSGFDFVSCDPRTPPPRNAGSRLLEVRLLPFGLQNLAGSNGYYEINCH